MNLCSQGDGREAVAKGLCEAHYRRQRRGQEVSGPIRNVTARVTLSCIKKLALRLGYSPSVREIQKCLGLASPSQVHKRLLILRREGLIVWEEGKKRSLRIVEGK